MAKAEVKEAPDDVNSDVIDELRRRYDRLTQSQKRIAEYIVEHPQAVAFSTVDQMAGELDVNPSTIVRFTYRLGLNGFPDLQERMREVVRGQLSRTGDPINESQAAGHLEGTSFGASLSHDWQNLHHTISGLDAEAFNRAISLLTRSRRVYVVAGFTTFPVAHYFALVLDRLRSDVSLLASNDAFATPRLVEIKPEDCVLAVTFPRYARGTHRVAMWAKENKAKVIASPTLRYRRWDRSPMSSCSPPRPAPACRIPWSRRWPSPTRCSTEWPRSRVRARSSATAVTTG